MYLEIYKRLFACRVCVGVCCPASDGGVGETLITSRRLVCLVHSEVLVYPRHMYISTSTKMNSLSISPTKNIWYRGSEFVLNTHT